MNASVVLPETPGADFDAVVVGAGFGGLYAVHKLRTELGLSVQAYDNADDVGGTWYWNRYPGALSDTESFCYRYSFDKQMLAEGTWKTRYITQPEILEYLNDVADRFDLRRSYQFNTKVTSAVFDEDRKLWKVQTDRGDEVTAKYLVTGLGLLSAINTPAFDGIGDFSGEIFHTGAWPQDVDLSGKRVGVIGTGSTGVQVIIALAPQVKHLTVFQRSAQYVVPIGNWPEDTETIDGYKARYDEIWRQIRQSAVAFGFEESTVSGRSLSAHERDAVFETVWQRGGGFRFMFETFSDVATDPEVNAAAADFIKCKISKIVKDPQVAAKLTPKDIYAKRPLCATDYFGTYNRKNVTLSDVKEDPIARFESNGIRLQSGAFHECDAVVFATGFDAVDGNYTKIEIRGRGGVALREKWADGPLGYLGMMEADFPNLFMILGPNGPFTNLPPSIETQVDWISGTIADMQAAGRATIEPTQVAVDEWVETCRSIANMTLFPKAESWIFGANIPGKKNAVMFYLGGLGNYRAALGAVKDAGYDTMIMDRNLELA